MLEEFDRLYIINLKRRLDRRLKILHQFDKLGLKPHIFSAVDGQTIKNKAKNLSHGEIAYIKTWRQILTEAEHENYQQIIIFDDDVWFHQEWYQHWTSFKNKLPDDWFLFYLGASQHVAIDTSSAQKKGFYHPYRTDGSFAVALSRTAIKTILARLRKSINGKPIYDGPLDSAVLRKILSEPNFNKKSFVCYPNLVIADVTNSDLRRSRSQTEMAQRFNWHLNDYLLNRLNYIPLISIIVTVFNAEKTIWAALMSVYNQNYPNIEIIIVDDCSLDRSLYLIEEWIKLVNGSKPVFLIKNQINKGCYVARNQALKQAKGELIAFQDADDVSLYDRLEIQAVTLWTERVLMVQSLILRTHLEEIDLTEQSFLERLERSRIHRKNNKYRHCCSATLGMATSLFRRSVLDQLGFFKELPCASDSEYCERLLAHYAKVSLTGDQNVVTYLTEISHIDGVYHKINQILYLCHQMRPSNLTRKYSPETRLRLQTQWRKTRSL